jgi:hypothetical protein
LFMKFTYADCVRLVPEWNGLALDIRELKGGITNQLYRFTSSCLFSLLRQVIST